MDFVTQATGAGPGTFIGMEFRRWPRHQRCLHSSNARLNRLIIAGLPELFPGIRDGYLWLSNCLSANRSRSADCQEVRLDLSAVILAAPPINASIHLTAYWPFDWPE
jgi:hypothetical protein